MSCEKYEDLLPLYVEGELSDEERRRVDEHLAACGACRESLASYRELESALVSLRDSRPSSSRAAALVSERLGLGRRWYPRAAWSGAAAGASAAFFVVAVVLYLFRGPVADFFARIGEKGSVGYSRAVGEWMQSAVQLAGGGEWVLLSVYLGLFALFMLTGSLMVLRFVRT